MKLGDEVQIRSEVFTTDPLTSPVTTTPDGDSLFIDRNRKMIATITNDNFTRLKLSAHPSKPNESTKSTVKPEPTL